MALAALAGAGVGLVYSLVGRPARRVPLLGPYLAGVIAVAGYLGCVLLLLAVVGAGDTRGGDLGVFALVTVLFGLLVGHKWFRPANAYDDVGAQ